MSGLVEWVSCGWSMPLGLLFLTHTQIRGKQLTMSGSKIKDLSKKLMKPIPPIHRFGFKLCAENLTEV